MSTFAPVVGLATILPQASFNPVPIIGAAAHTPPFVSPLPQASWNIQPIIGASVRAILFPTLQGTSFCGYPI